MLKVLNTCDTMVAKRHFCIRQIGLILLLISLLEATTPALADTNEPTEEAALFEMSMEELLNVEISVVSKKSETQFEAPGIVVVVPRDEFELYGDRDLHQLMQRQPSVYTRDTFPHSDNVAGFRGDMSTVAEMHTLILFNGRPIRESAQGHNVNMYKTFPLSALESVELIRGPGSVLYGSNAFTGVINLKPRVPDKSETSVSTMLGSYGYYETNFMAGGKSGDCGYVTAFRVAGQQGYRYKMTDALGVYGEDNKQYKSYSTVAHMDYQRFNFDFFYSDYDAFALGVTPWWSNRHHILRNKKIFFNAGYRAPLHERVTLELNGTYNVQENSLTSYMPWIIGTNTSDLLGEITLFANPIDSMNIVLGYLHEYRSNYHPQSHRFQSIPKYNYKPKSAYAQGDLKIGKSIKLIAGMQWHESSQKEEDLISRFGIIYQPFKKWGIKLLRGEAFRAPVTIETDLFDPPVLVGNDEIQPETITTYDAQLFYHDEKTYAAITYFDSKIEQLIIYDYSVSPTSYINGGIQRFRGIEFEAKRSITPNWHILGSFMHQENDGDVGLNPTVAPENMLKVGTSYTWDWGSLGVFCTHFGRPPRISSPVVVNPEPDSVSLVSMNLNLDISNCLQLDKGQCILTLRAENIFDKEIYVPTFAYSGSPNTFPYGPGRTLYFGMKLFFD